MSWSVSFGTSLNEKEFAEAWKTNSAAFISPPSTNKSISTTVDGKTLFIASGYGAFQINGERVRDIYGRTSFLVAVQNGAIAWSHVLQSSKLYDIFHCISEADAEGNHVVGSYEKLYKYNQSGQLLWEKDLSYTPHGTSGVLVPHRKEIAMHRDGSFLIIGTNTSGRDFQIGNLTVAGGQASSHGTGASYIAKADKNGDFLWAKNLESQQHSRNSTVETFENGDSAVHYWIKDGSSAQYSGSRLTRLDADGNKQWTVDLRGSFATAMTTTNDGKLIVELWSEGAITQIGNTTIAYDDFDTTYRNRSGAIVMLNEGGEVEWFKTTKNIKGMDIKYHQGKVILGGFYSQNSSIDGNKLGNEMHSSGFLLASLDPSNGAQVSNKFISKSQFSGGYHNKQASIIDDQTIQITGSYFKGTPVNIAGTSLIDQDKEWSTYIARLNGNDLPKNNQPSDIALSSLQFDENIDPGSVVASISATDPDTNDSVTYSFVSGPESQDNEKFQINGSEISIIQSPDFEKQSTYSIRLKATDAGGLALEKSFLLRVNDLSELPENKPPTNISLSSIQFNENINAGSFVASISADDPDKNETFSYTFVSGSNSQDNNKFQINENNISVNHRPDFEQQSSYSIRLKVTDRGQASFEKSFTLRVNDLSESTPSIPVTTPNPGPTVGPGTATQPLPSIPTPPPNPNPAPKPTPPSAPISTPSPERPTPPVSSPITNILDAILVQSIAEVQETGSIALFELSEPIQTQETEINTALIGTSRKDSITGSSTKEILLGGADRDRLKGGGSADGFLFKNEGNFGKKFADIILDFNNTEGDTILLNGEAFKLKKRLKYLSTNDKRATKQASRSNKKIIYDQSKGFLFFNDNGKRSGWGEGGLFAKVRNTPVLDSSDFTIV